MLKWLQNKFAEEEKDKEMKDKKDMDMEEEEEEEEEESDMEEEEEEEEEYKKKMDMEEDEKALMAEAFSIARSTRKTSPDPEKLLASAYCAQLGNVGKGSIGKKAGDTLASVHVLFGEKEAHRILSSYTEGAIKPPSVKDDKVKAKEKASQEKIKTFEEIVSEYSDSQPGVSMTLIYSRMAKQNPEAFKKHQEVHV